MIHNRIEYKVTRPGTDHQCPAWRHRGDQEGLAGLSQEADRIPPSLLLRTLLRGCHCCIFQILPRPGMERLALTTKTFHTIPRSSPHVSFFFWALVIHKLLLTS